MQNAPVGLIFTVTKSLWTARWFLKVKNMNLVNLLHAKNYGKIIYWYDQINKIASKKTSPEEHLLIPDDQEFLISDQTSVLLLQSKWQPGDC